MYSAQLRAREIVGVFRRRWKYPFFSTIIVTGVCIIGAFSLERKYESTTTILVRPDQTLSPIPGYDLAMAFEEQLRNFDEIIHSHSLLQALVDSLGLSTRATREPEMETLIKAARGNISTTRLGSDSFRITFVDSDPARAQRGAEIIANLFISAKIKVATRQNDLTVQFYEQKVAEYRQDFESSVKTMVSSLQQHVQEMPVESRALYTQIDEIERNLNTLDAQIKTLQEKLLLLRTLPQLIETSPDEFRKEDGKQPLFELERSNLPYSIDLRTLLTQYDQITRRYRGKYPEVEKLEAQIVDLLKRMLVAAESEITNLQYQRSNLEKHRAQIIEQLKAGSVAQQETHDKESSYDNRKRLYDDMKVKLEQARLAKEVGARGANQFIILDPALVPTIPTKPNRAMIVVAGFGLGLLLGIIASIAAELLDTTVRTPRDVEVYQKPIIAFLPDGTSKAVRRRI